MDNRHKRTKMILRAVGLVLLVGGITLTIIGFMHFGDFDSNLFMLTLAGLPCTGGGIGLTLSSFSQNIARYVKNEQIPVLNELAQDISPAVQTYAASVKEGFTADEKTVCECGASNDSTAKFCSNCGKALQKACVSCGKQLTMQDKFCPECGTKVE